MLCEIVDISILQYLNFVPRYGLVESRIRNLISALEHNPNIHAIHANPSGFHSIDPDYKEIPHTAWTLGIDFKKNTSEQIDLTSVINNFVKIGKFFG